MHLNRPATFALTAAFAILASSCTLPFTPWTPGESPVFVAMDNPYRASLLPLRSATRLMASASSDRAGVEAIEFFANGISLGVVPTDRTAPAVSAALDWTPTAAGTIVFQAHARGPSGVRISDPVTVCVASILRFPADGYAGPCAFGPDSSAEAVRILSASAIPAAWAYDNGRCPATVDSAPGISIRSIRFTFDVDLDDPGRRAAIVVINATNRTEPGTATGGLTLGATETVSGPGDRREYEVTMPFVGSLIDDGPGSIEWEVAVYSAAGEILATSGILRIPIYVCSMPESGFEPLVIEATPTPDGASPTTTIAPTATLLPTTPATSVPTDKPTTDPNDVDDDGDGQTENGGDCDDKNDKVYKGAPETEKDGVDSNCDGYDDT